MYAPTRAPPSARQAKGPQCNLQLLPHEIVTADSEITK